MNTIETIRAEIERRKNTAETLRERNICIDLLFFLDTLGTTEKYSAVEQPVCEELEGLEEEIQEYMSNEDNNPFDWDWRDKRDCARHFAQWGEKRSKAYRKGKLDMKQEMMTEAVEGDIGMILHDKTSDLFVRSKGYLPKSLGIKCDDKVKLIIIKED